MNNKREEKKSTKEITKPTKYKVIRLKSYLIRNIFFPTQKRGDTLTKKKGH